MNKKLLYHLLVCLLTLCGSLNAQHTLKPNDKESGWTYSTIAELNDLAKKHLASLDAQIADKKAASESLFNPFRSKAKERHSELVGERKAFLDQTWTCPYWQRCNNCDGGNKQWFVGDGTLGTGPCWKCRRQNGYKSHGNHHGDDKEYSCSPSTIRALLKVTD